MEKNNKEKKILEYNKVFFLFENALLRRKIYLLRRYFLA